MTNIKIKTLTSIHIGSGNTLSYGNDFVQGYAKDRYDVLGIIALEKVLGIIGMNNLSTWVSQIEQNIPTDSIIQRFNKSINLEDYSSRTILNYADSVKSSDSLKEFLYDGCNKPYIPGSSIKGAIRTAVLATLANNIQGKENMIGAGGRKVSGAYIEKSVFGKDPNSDVFRFLQVGDAVFDTNYEMAAVRMVNINERTSRGFLDTSKSQLVEVMLSDSDSSFGLNIKSDYCDIVRKQQSAKGIPAIPECMRDIQTLFQTINLHTLKLLKEESEYWQLRKDADTSHSVENYLDNIESLLNSVKKCISDNNHSCVLRLGHGSGWRFITGAWPESLANFKNVVVPAARPGNQHYSQYAFPKSRRVDEEGELLGFVLLET